MTSRSRNGTCSSSPATTTGMMGLPPSPISFATRRPPSAAGAAGSSAAISRSSFLTTGGSGALTSRLGDSLDVAQRHYFEAIVAKQVAARGQGHHRPACPRLVQARVQGADHDLPAGPQEGRGVRDPRGGSTPLQQIRVASREPKLHLITSGGGGAFAHPTHDQKGRRFTCARGGRNRSDQERGQRDRKTHRPARGAGGSRAAPDTAI